MGKLEEIEKLFEERKTEEEIIQLGYNKGSITKVKNKRDKQNNSKKKLLVENKIDIASQIQEVLNMLDENYQYIITVKKEKKDESIANIYLEYKEKGNEKFIEKIKFWDKEKLSNLAKQLGEKKLENKNKLEIINIICDRIEGRLRLGKVFRE